MPRSTQRQKAIVQARRLFRFFVRLSALTGASSSNEEESSDSVESFSSASSASEIQGLLAWSFARLRRKERNRYEDRMPYRSHTYASPQYERDLSLPDNENEVAWLNQTDFLRKYRMPREAFTDLLLLIKDDPVFVSGYEKGRQQRPVEYQLMTLLKFLGSEGTASSNPDLRNVFNTGHGTNLLYVRRAVQALRNIREAFLSWPDTEERDAIAAGILEKSGLPNCVGIIDGTLFPLAFAPQTEDAPDYKGRKHLYTLSSVIVCDHNRLIRYYVAGWPGSTHDNRIARNTSMWNHPTTYYRDHEYIIGDSAFENNWFMVSAFTSPPGESLVGERSQFNSCMARARVISEHTIGLLKGRFPWLRSIRKVITEDPGTLRDILGIIDACVIIHNFLVQRGLEEKEEELYEDDNVTVLDEYERLPEGDELMQCVPIGSPGDHRRTQLLFYLKERGLI